LTSRRARRYAHDARHTALSGADPEENQSDCDVFRAAASHEVASDTIGVVRPSRAP
jgi:hypothetical protein